MTFFCPEILRGADQERGGGSVPSDVLRVAGFGFRSRATVESLLAALDAAGGAGGVVRLATASRKASESAFADLATRLGLPVEAVSPERLTSITTATEGRSRETDDTGSLAEAAALASAGPGARLVAPRAVSPDRLATCAIAITGETP